MSSQNALVPVAARLATAVGVSVAIGVLTAYAQGWLPSELGSLANSAGLWALVAFGLALLLATGERNAALLGGLSLLGLLIGYVIGDDAKGYTSGSTLVAFWGLAAVVAGPVLGFAAFWVKSGRGVRPGIGIGLMSGVLVGEGIYGLAFISGTTYKAYWWAETIAGVILAACLLARAPGGRNAAVATVVTAGTAAVFVALYSADLISALP
jgi:hypothetical protein